MAYVCFGKGKPTVIIESAVNDAPTVTGTWNWVTDKIQTITRICIYDRAGLEPSGAAPTPRTSQDVAQDLHVLLNKIPLSGPYILVGHSIGGFHVRVFAHLYPQDVAGIILVDSTPIDQMKAFATAYPTYSPNEASILTANRAAIFDLVPPDEVEGLDILASAEQVRQAGSLGNLPLIVISQSTDPNHYVVPGFSLEDQERLASSWQSQQADMATLSSKGVFMTSKTAGHYIPIEDPQIIIDAITQMVQEIRKQGTRSQELSIGVIIGVVIVVLSFLLLIMNHSLASSAVSRIATPKSGAQAAEYSSSRESGIKKAAQHAASGDLAKAQRENIGMRFLISC